MGIRNKKNNLSESGSFNMPEKTERKKGEFEDFITKFLGKIYLNRDTFFGLDSNKIVIIITPSLKIASILSKPKKLLRDFPLSKDEILDFVTLKSWASQNEYEITFAAETPKLKRTFYSQLGDVMVESHDKNSDTYISLYNELENSNLPQSIKEWAKNNPEKFMKNMDEVKKLLGE
jgi:hypothetical protein